MSAALTDLRRWRYGSQLVAGITIALALGVAFHQAHAEDAASLLANPKRLDMVQAGCRTNQPWATEALCREAAQAIRLRFRGAGVRYTLHRVEPHLGRQAVKPPAPTVPGSQSSTHALPPAPSRIL